jgi:hypothetical protein
MVYTIVGAETLISPISERGATHQLLRLKDSMQKRGTESLHLISMLNAEKLLSLYQKGEPITITLPQSGYSYRFKIDKVKEDNQKKIFYAVNGNGVSKGRLTLSFNQDIGIGIITLPEGTFILHVYKDKGWIGKKHIQKMIDEEGILPSHRSEKKPISSSKKLQNHYLKNRTLKNVSPYEIKWMVYLSQVLADTFLSKI